jgi:dihydrofolate reductase
VTRPLIESTLVSLDGVISHPERWAVFDDEARQWALANLRGYDGFVLGRTTYEIFHAAWAPIHGDPYLDAINAAPKYVVSSAPVDPGWNATALTGDPADAVAELKEAPGRPLIKYGTGLLSRTLYGRGLIDELHLSISPVRVGAGKRLFEDLDGPAPPLALTSTRTLRTGVVILTYRVGPTG